MEITKATAIEKTFYKKYFDSVEQNAVYLFDAESAEFLWNKHIDQRATSYFKLPNDSWLVTSKNETIGEWIEAYNNSNNLIVSELLSKIINWKLDTIVRFFINKTSIIETTWEIFLKHWDNFLAAHDDCPVLMSENNDAREALIFTAIGKIIKIEKAR